MEMPNEVPQQEEYVIKSPVSPAGLMVVITVVLQIIIGVAYIVSMKSETKSIADQIANLSKRLDDMETDRRLKGETISRMDERQKNMESDISYLKAAVEMNRKK